MHTRFPLTGVALAALLALQPALAEEIVVTGSIVERAVVDAPYAIGVVGRDVLRDSGPQINLSESLARVPGLMVANRSNFAQDLQIGSRGFGARATFGVRGIRLLSDGIPASGPDGQGQVSQFDLGSAERVEVLRGPFSVLYGNSSGGVISLVSAPVKKGAYEGEVDAGSFGLRQVRASIASPLGAGFDLRVSGSAMQIDGFRPQSEARRGLLNARLGWKDEDDSVVVLGGLYTQPADDPLGLTRAQFDADPYQTTSQATQFDTRQESTQQNIGTTWKHRFGDGALRDLQLMAYAGRRSVTQYLAIIDTTQNNVRHGGGVIDFDRDFKGAEARLRFGWTSVDLQVGAALDDQADDRRGYENYLRGTTPPVYGVIGNLRRDETNRARSADVFGQAEWAAGAGLTVSGGLRSGRVKLSTEDRYFNGVNGDDSGAVEFSYTNPVLGLRWEAAPGLQLHASAARGFESPTLGEIAYRVDGSNGINFDLKPQKSRQFELGAKWRAGAFDADVALFDIATEDEIGVATNAGGRSAFQNVGRTQRRGLEVGGAARLGGGFSARVAYTYLDATYRDPFVTCVAIPCNLTTGAGTAAVTAGNRIAGTQRHNGFAEAAWATGVAGTFGLEVRGVSGTTANDTNTAFADKYALAALRWGYRIPIGGALDAVELLARVDNLTDKRYAGSVIVNEANGRYYETGAPRAALLAVRLLGNL